MPKRKASTSNANIESFAQKGNAEVNGNGNNGFKNEGQNDQSIITTDQQQLEEFRQKIAKMEMEFEETKHLFVINKLELEDKAFQAELEKQKLRAENIELRAKVAKMEQDQLKQNQQKENLEETSENAADRLSVKRTENCAKIGQLEGKEKANCEQQMMNAKNGQFVVKIEEAQQSNNVLDFVNAMQTKVTKSEEQPKNILAKMKQRQNRWNAKKCPNGLTICEPNNLTIHHNGNSVWRYVFAKYSILDASSASGDTFYFEVSIKNVKYLAIFGIAPKQMNPLDALNPSHKSTYAYGGGGDISIDGSDRNGIEAFGVHINGGLSPLSETFGNGDVVGFGVNLANEKLFFTKNGIINFLFFN